MTDTMYHNERTKTYDIPLSHLDFKYIRDCSDLKELEKIMKTLRTGEVGRYAELEKCCEDRIRELDPNSRVLRVTVPLGSIAQLNLEERQEIETGLQQWLSEMKDPDDEHPQKDAEIMKRVNKRVYRTEEDIEREDQALTYDEDLPPVRKEMYFKASSQSATWARCSGDGLYPRKFVKPKDYSEWDKLEKEWDKELENEVSGQSIQRNEQSKIPEKGENMDVSEAEIRGLSKLNLQDLCKRVRTLPEFTRRQLATREKEKGNESFRAGDYEEALFYYKRSLVTFPMNAVHSNRALVYLHQKKWSEAAKECAHVLKDEPNNEKALFRSGRANYELHNLERAERDLEHLTDLDPTNTKAQNLLRTVRAEKSKRQTSRLAGGRRMVITEVGDTSSSSDEDNTVEQTKHDKRICSESMDNANIVKQAEKSDPVSAQEKNLSRMKENTTSSTIPENSSKTYRVRSRNAYPASRPGRQGIVIEELSDTEVVEHDDEVGNADTTIDHLTSVTLLDPEGHHSVETSNVVPREKHGFSDMVCDIQHCGDNSENGENVKFEPNMKDDEFTKTKEAGKRYLEQGDLQQSLDCYSKCISMASKQKDVLAASYRNRAVVALRLGLNQLAMEDCTKALELEPGSPVALYRRALARRSLTDYTGSLNDLEKAYQLRPTSQNIAYELEKSRQLVKQNPNPTKQITEAETKRKLPIDDLSEFELIDVSSSNMEDLESGEVRQSAEHETKKTIGNSDWELVSVPAFSSADSAEISELNEAIAYLGKITTGPLITASNFSLRWTGLRSLHGPVRMKEIIKLLHDVHPDRLKEVIGIKLDASILDDVTQSLHWLCCAQDNCLESLLDFAFKTLENLSQISRFDCTVCLIEDASIRAVNMLFDQFVSTLNIDAEQLERIKSKYST